MTGSDVTERDLAFLRGLAEPGRRNCSGQRSLLEELMLARHDPEHRSSIGAELSDCPVLVAATARLCTVIAKTMGTLACKVPPNSNYPGVAC